MGPESAKTFPGQTLVETSGLTAGRAKQEIDYGRRGKGYIFGAFRPATGEAFTRPYLSRSTACWVAFLEEVELWLPAESERVYAILDNLSAHRATDVLLFMLAHPRWEMVYLPKLGFARQGGLQATSMRRSSRSAGIFCISRPVGEGPKAVDAHNSLRTKARASLNVA